MILPNLLINLRSVLVLIRTKKGVLAEEASKQKDTILIHKKLLILDKTKFYKLVLNVKGISTRKQCKNISKYVISFSSSIFFN